MRVNLFKNMDIQVEREEEFYINCELKDSYRSNTRGSYKYSNGFKSKFGGLLNFRKLTVVERI